MKLNEVKLDSYAKYIYAFIELMYKNLKFLPSRKLQFLFLLLNLITLMEKINLLLFLKDKKRNRIYQLGNI